MKRSYILRWNHEGMVLSDGSTREEFNDHDEAIKALEEEVAKVELRVARKAIDIGKDWEEYYRLAELEVVREFPDKVLLYGVSDYYLRPFAGINAVQKIRYNGQWYRNVQCQYYKDDERAGTMPDAFFQRAHPGEYVCYYEHLIFRTEKGFVATPNDDLTNGIEI